MSEKPVDFGYQKVSPAEKTKLVGGVFKEVASRYDLMNDFMSFGSHRILKRILLISSKNISQKIKKKWQYSRKKSKAETT